MTAPLPPGAPTFVSSKSRPGSGTFRCGSPPSMAVRHSAGHGPFVFPIPASSG